MLEEQIRGAIAEMKTNLQTEKSFDIWYMGYRLEINIVEEKLPIFKAVDIPKEPKYDWGN